MDFPEELNQLESHLTWIPNILSNLKLEERTERFNHVLGQLTKNKLNEQYLQGQVLGEDGEESRIKWEECLPTWASFLSTKLNMAAKAVFVRDMDFAEHQMVEIRMVLNKLSEVHREKLFQVGSYAVEALEWSMLTMLQKSSAQVIQEDVALDQWDKNMTRLRLRGKWEEFQGDETTRAVILFWKQLFEMDLLQTYGVEMQRHVEKLEEVIELDPNYHLWYHYALLMTRKARHFGMENGDDLIPKGPSAKEIKWAEKQLDLAPRVLTTYYDFGLLLKDKLNVLEAFGDQDVAELFERSCAYFDEALSLAEEHELSTHWKMEIKMEKAELVARWGGDADLTLLLDCWHMKECKDHAVLHQILAEIYHYGIKTADGDYLRKDFKNAELHYRLALAAKQRINYFACLKNYMKLLPYLPPPSLPEGAFELQFCVRLRSALPTPESINAFQLLTNSLATLSLFDSLDYERNYQFEKSLIRVWRACILWEYNPERDSNHKGKACLEWIKVVQNYSHCPQVAKTIMSNIWTPPFSGNNGTFYAVQKKDVRAQLRRMKEEMDSDMKTLVDICTILKKLDIEIDQEECMGAASSNGTAARRRRSSANDSFSMDSGGKELTRWRRSWNGEQQAHKQSRRTSSGNGENQAD